MAQAFVPVTGPGSSKRAFWDLRQQWGTGALLCPGRELRHAAGFHGCSLYWRPELQVWGFFEPIDDPQDRYWIGWGSAPPYGRLAITATTTVPLEGFDRSLSGVFLRDADGGVHLAHSGRVGGRKGTGKDDFRAYAELSDWVEVHWPDGVRSDCLLVGRLGDPTLLDRIAAFVHEVARFKRQAASERRNQADART